MRNAQSSDEGLLRSACNRPDSGDDHRWAAPVPVREGRGRRSTVVTGQDRDCHSVSTRPSLGAENPSGVVTAADASARAHPPGGGGGLSAVRRPGGGAERTAEHRLRAGDHQQPGEQRHVSRGRDDHVDSDLRSGGDGAGTAAAATAGRRAAALGRIPEHGGRRVDPRLRLRRRRGRS